MVKLVDMVENYMSDNRIGIEDILKIDHSRFVNSNGDIITTIMLVYKKRGRITNLIHIIIRMLYHREQQ